MTSEPFFSVIIPTRNRAHLLRYSLQSALDQSFDNYEIVVSNNCSEDNTGEVARDVGGSRVRYVEPDQTLSMPDHWEFALEQARGQYVTYLCDDDAWCPDILRRVAEVVAGNGNQLVVSGSAAYYGSNWLNPGDRNSLSIRSHTGQTRSCNSSETLEYLFQCVNTFHAPRMLNSFCHRDALARVRADVGRLFLLCPDYSFAALILTDVLEWSYIDEPLRLQGVFAEGIGSSQVFDRGKPSQEFLREFNDTRFFKRAPLQVPVVTNYIAETLLMCKEKAARQLADYQIDWKHYFINCWQDLLLHENNGVAVDADKEEFFLVLARQPAEVQRAVRRVVSPQQPEVAESQLNPRNGFRRLARTIVNSSKSLRQFESRVRGPRVTTAPIVETLPVDEVEPAVVEELVVSFKGDEAGFDNILECAKKLSALVKISEESGYPQEGFPSRTRAGSNPGN